MRTFKDFHSLVQHSIPFRSSGQLNAHGPVSSVVSPKNCSDLNWEGIHESNEWFEKVNNALSWESEIFAPFYQNLRVEVTGWDDDALTPFRPKYLIALELTGHPHYSSTVAALDTPITYVANMIRYTPSDTKVAKPCSLVITAYVDKGKKGTLSAHDIKGYAELPLYWFGTNQRTPCEIRLYRAKNTHELSSLTVNLAIQFEAILKTLKTKAEVKNQLVTAVHECIEDPEAQEEQLKKINFALDYNIDALSMLDEMRRLARKNKAKGEEKQKDKKHHNSSKSAMDYVSYLKHHQMSVDKFQTLMKKLVSSKTGLRFQSQFKDGDGDALVIDYIRYLFNSLTRTTDFENEKRVGEDAKSIQLLEAAVTLAACTVGEEPLLDPHILTFCPAIGLSNLMLIFDCFQYLTNDTVVHVFKFLCDLCDSNARDVISAWQYYLKIHNETFQFLLEEAENGNRKFKFSFFFFLNCTLVAAGDDSKERKDLLRLEYSQCGLGVEFVDKVRARTADPDILLVLDQYEEELASLLPYQMTNDDIRRDNQVLVQQLKEAKAASRNYKEIIEGFEDLPQLKLSLEQSEVTIQELKQKYEKALQHNDQFREEFERLKKENMPEFESEEIARLKEEIDALKLRLGDDKSSDSHAASPLTVRHSASTSENLSSGTVSLTEPSRPVSDMSGISAQSAGEAVSFKSIKTSIDLSIDVCKSVTEANYAVAYAEAHKLPEIPSPAWPELLLASQNALQRIVSSAQLDAASTDHPIRRLARSLAVHTRKLDADVLDRVAKGDEEATKLVVKATPSIIPIVRSLIEEVGGIDTSLETLLHKIAKANTAYLAEANKPKVPESRLTLFVKEKIEKLGPLTNTVFYVAPEIVVRQYGFNTFAFPLFNPFKETIDQLCTQRITEREMLRLKAKEQGAGTRGTRGARGPQAPKGQPTQPTTEGHEKTNTATTTGGMLRNSVGPPEMKPPLANANANSNANAGTRGPRGPRAPVQPTATQTAQPGEPAQPAKKYIKLCTKLEGGFKVAGATEGTIFSSLDDSLEESKHIVDATLLQDMFVQVAAGEKKNTEKKDEEQEIELVDAKRLQTVGIVLKKLSNVDGLIATLNKCEFQDGFTVDMLETVTGFFLPTVKNASSLEKEMKTLTTLESCMTDGKPDLVLAQEKLKPEVLFLWRVWNYVKDVKTKIDLLLWKVEFDQKKLLVSSDIVKCRTASLISKKVVVKDIFASIIQMSTSLSPDRVSGFTLDKLNVLSSVKSTTNPGETVLSYLVLQLDKSKPSHMQAVHGFAKKFEEAAKVVADVLKIIPNTTMQYFKITDLLKKTDPESDPEFYESMSKLMREVSGLIISWSQNLSEVDDYVDYLGGIMADQVEALYAPLLADCYAEWKTLEQKNILIPEESKQWLRKVLNTYAFFDILKNFFESMVSIQAKRIELASKEAELLAKEQKIAATLMASTLKTVAKEVHLLQTANEEAMATAREVNALLEEMQHETDRIQLATTSTVASELGKALKEKAALTTKRVKDAKLLIVASKKPLEPVPKQATDAERKTASLQASEDSSDEEDILPTPIEGLLRRSASIKSIHQSGNHALHTNQRLTDSMHYRYQAASTPTESDDDLLSPRKQTLAASRARRTVTRKGTAIRFSTIRKSA